MITFNIALKFLASGSYVIIYIYANETFPTQGRNTGMGACSMVARLGAIIGTFSNDHLVKIFHIQFFSHSFRIVDSSMATFSNCCLRCYFDICNDVCNDSSRDTR